MSTASSREPGHAPPQQWRHRRSREPSEDAVGEKLRVTALHSHG